MSRILWCLQSRGPFGERLMRVLIPPNVFWKSSPQERHLKRSGTFGSYDELIRSALTRDAKCRICSIEVRIFSPAIRLAHLGHLRRWLKLVSDICTLVLHFLHLNRCFAWLPRFFLPRNVRLQLLAIFLILLTDQGLFNPVIFTLYATQSSIKDRTTTPAFVSFVL